MIFLGSMFSINLLPAYEKKVIRMEEMRRAVVFFSVLTLAVFSAGILLLMPSLLVMRFTAGELLRSLTLEEESVRQGTTGEAIMRLRAARDAIRAIHISAAESSGASAVLERFVAPGHGLTVISLAVRGDGQTVISGHAETRADLLRFEEALRASNRFYEITFPLSNITRERNIQFSIHGKLKPEHGL